MEAELRLSGNGAADVYPLLWKWLQNERPLQGRARWSSGVPGDTSLGAPDWITVALGAGGAGTALAASLGNWLGRVTQPGLKLKITRRGPGQGDVDEIEVEVARLNEDNRRFIADLLRPDDRTDGEEGVDPGGR